MLKENHFFFSLNKIHYSHRVLEMLNIGNLATFFNVDYC
jgi:hypothetical protein